MNLQNPDLNLVQHNLVHLLTVHQGQWCTLRLQEQCITAEETVESCCVPAELSGRRAVRCARAQASLGCGASPTSGLGSTTWMRTAHEGASLDSKRCTKDLRAKSAGATLFNEDHEGGPMRTTS